MEVADKLDELYEMIEAGQETINGNLHEIQEIIASAQLAININSAVIHEMLIMVIAALGFIGGTTLFRHLRK